ncbi:MAG: sugar transferase [Clostridia bacterium]|jgi:O-antigen biosynthesis protein WbqP
MYFIIKRILDIVISVLGMIILLPVFLFIFAAIKLDSKGPILFKQMRIGIHKKSFIMLKFRTMSIDTPKNIPTHLLKEPDNHITKIGKILRKTSLDELPQIWNIFLGQMSIVGPRPALINQHDLIGERDKNGANEIKPGLTGWAQINGRDKLNVKGKAELDGEYVRKMSIWFDIKCFFRTFVHVIREDGVLEGDTDDISSENNFQ